MRPHSVEDVLDGFNSARDDLMATVESLACEEFHGWLGFELLRLLGQLDKCLALVLKRSLERCNVLMNGVEALVLREQVLVLAE